MSKNRDKQRANKKKYQNEAALDNKNAYGIDDPTPRSAVNRIIDGGKSYGYET